MVADERVMPMTFIRHRGFFDYSKLLKSIHGWFTEEDFTDLQIPMHKQKLITPMGVDHDFYIDGKKKVTEYVRFTIKVGVRLMNIRDVEIIQDGKKIKLQDAQIIVEITPILIFDWQDRFVGKGWYGAFIKFLDEIYRKYIIKYKIGDYWEDMILIKAGQLARVIREALGQEVM